MKSFIKDNLSTIFTIALIALFFIIGPFTILLVLALFIYLLYKFRHQLPRPKVNSVKSKPYKPKLRKVKHKNSYQFDEDEFLKNNMYMSAKEKAEYLLSSKWKKLRQQVFKRDNYQCVTCKSTLNLNCHHIVYYRLGEEKLKDLTTLCNNCHEELHEELGYSRSGYFYPKHYKGKL